MHIHLIMNISMDLQTMDWQLSRMIFNQAALARTQ